MAMILLSPQTQIERREMTPTAGRGMALPMSLTMNTREEKLTSMGPRVYSLRITTMIHLIPIGDPREVCPLHGPALGPPTFQKKIRLLPYNRTVSIVESDRCSYLSFGKSNALLAGPISVRFVSLSMQNLMQGKMFLRSFRLLTFPRKLSVSKKRGKIIVLII